ncbi:kinetochore protein ndc80 [Ischnura elegans]|uniref:kinetochore protein ndc80 n=1 Tax=Ischnura elegans TaxID=197161 RepID=UPI001ED8708B|nr:kinetochore protein ndc80 [Ischnura elegans]
MDPLTKIRKRFSMGRRSSVDPIKFSAEDSCIMAAEEKKPKSGIPRIVVAGGSKRRSSSSDRTYSVSKASHDGTFAAGSAAGVLFTPVLNPVTPRVSLSARKAIDCISQLSAKSHTARKEQRTALDKNSQIRLSRHVASYLNRTGLVGDLLAGGQGRAPAGLIQSSDLKNMNKGAFIALFNLLYKKVGSRRKVEFNSSNYHDSIPTIAKKLGYPGVIYKSHLLTPNTPHSWPYVIAFLGWLVDLVVLQEPFEVALESSPESLNSPMNEAMAVKEFYMKSYVAYINEEIEEPPIEHVMEFRERINSIRDMQPDLIQEMVMRRDQIKNLADSDQKALDQIKDQREKLYSEIEGIVADIENLGVNNSKQAAETAELMTKSSKNCAKKEGLVAMLEQQRKDRDDLKVICSNQKLSKPEWDQLVADNKATREGNQMLVEMCEQTKKVVDSLDLKISAIRNKLHKVWFEIMERCMSVPAESAQVTHLMALINNFSHLAPDAQRQYMEILDVLNKALTEINGKVQQDQARAIALQDKLRETNLSVIEIRKKGEHTAKELEKLKHEWRLTAKKLDEVEKELRGKVQQVLDQIKYMHSTSPENCFEEMEKTKKRYQEKVEELAAKKQEYASALSEMQKMSESYVKYALQKLTWFQSEASRLSKEISKFDKD